MNKRKFSLGEIVSKLNKAEDEHPGSEQPLAHPPVQTEKKAEPQAQTSQQASDKERPAALPLEQTEYALPKQPSFDPHSHSTNETYPSGNKYHHENRSDQKTDKNLYRQSAQATGSTENIQNIPPLSVSNRPAPFQSPELVDKFKNDDNDDDEEAIDVFKYIAIVLRRRYVIIAIALLSVLFSVYRYTTSDKYYITKARLLFSPDQQDLSNDSRLFLLRFDREKQLNTHLELLKSPSVLSLVAENMGNAIPPTAISMGLMIKQGETNGEKTDIVELSYKNRDPDDARDVLNELCRTYIDYRRDVNTQEVSRLITKLEIQIDKLQSDLNDKENSLRFFKEENKMIQLSSESNIAVSKLSEMEISLQKTNLDIIESRERQQELKSQISNQELNIVQSMTYSDPFKNRLSDLELQLNTLSSEYSSEHYKVKSIKDQIERLKDATIDSINREAASHTLVKNPIRQSLLQEMINLTIEIAALETKRIAQEKLIEQLNGELIRLPQLEQRYIFLQRETESTLQTLRTLKSKHEEAKIRKDSQESDLKILEIAETPQVPIRKVKFTIIFIGLLAGIIIGIALAFVIEYLDQSIKDPHEVEKSLELPLLGIVPHIEADQELFEQMDLSKNIFEPFRALRANLKHIASTHKLKTFIICSAVKGEGKTTLSANLSITFAMDGKKVILIDADLRRSQMHTLFNVSKETGLADYLLGTSTVDEILKPTRFENLSLITSGERPYNPAELLGTPLFDNLIQELRQRGDFIIFDSPALLPVSDTITMAPKMDGCLVVVRTLWTPVKAAQQAKNQLKRVGCRIFGGILNGVVHSKGYYPYYYGYYGYYSYKYTYDDDTPKSFSIRELGLNIERNLKEYLRSFWLGIPKIIAKAGIFLRYFLSRPLFWILLIVSVLLFISQMYIESKRPQITDETIHYIGMGRTSDNQGTSLEYKDMATFSRQQPVVTREKEKIHFSDSLALKDSLHLWLQAKERADTSRLFRFYHPEFKPSDVSIINWKKSAQKNLNKLQQNKYNFFLTSLEEKKKGDDFVEIELRYRMNTMRDTSDNRVAMIWKKFNSQWRIIREYPFVRNDPARY
ncbi:MAG: polysaccharide biosynthesis tyrosine autokinase [Chitinispirillaceae bacterium]|nr:polysaccharide biosynthesis tyrosine autokinase [Chitinispirillaceae bacterium]